jgi:hypothetical protein
MPQPKDLEESDALTEKEFRAKRQQGIAITVELERIEPWNTSGSSQP